MPDAPEVPATRSPRRGLRIGIIAASVAVLALGYVAVCAAAPLPELHPRLTVDAAQTYRPDPEVSPQRIVNQQDEPTAIGWADDTGAWTNDFDTPRQLASITKIVTVLVCLDAEPVEAGSDGPRYTLTERDAEIREDVLRSDGVVADVPVGRSLTTRQFVELALLPSANNYAIGLAERVFGTNAAFQKAVVAWAADHDLRTLRISEPSGLSDRNVASATDVVELGRLALAEPLIAEVVAEPWTEIPGIGPIENSNPLLGDEGVVGIKTGTLSSVGYNLLVARESRVGDRESVAIAAVLGRPTPKDRARDSRAVMRDAPKAVDAVTLVDAEARIGTVRTWQGRTVELRPAKGATAALLPAETASRTVEVGAMGAGEAGRTAGVIRVSAPDGNTSVPVITSAEIVEPDLWWRLTHPIELLTR